MAALQDKVALITGGERGIGLATARVFIAEGARVHLVGIDEPKLASAVQALGADVALASLADVTQEEAVQRAIEEGSDRFGRLDVVVSNAGISGDVSEIPDYPSGDLRPDPRGPRARAERAYPTVIYYNEVDRGGHFAAWQEPHPFSQEVRAAFRSLR